MIGFYHPTPARSSPKNLISNSEWMSRRSASFWLEMKRLCLLFNSGPMGRNLIYIFLKCSLLENPDREKEV